MSNEKGPAKFLLYALTMLFLFLTLLPIIFSFTGLGIRIQLFFFVLLLFVSFIGLTTYTTGGERLLYIAFTLHLINLLAIWFLTQKLYLLAVFLALFGFVLSFPRKPDVYEEEMPLSSEIEVAKESQPKVHSQVIHSPGKFAASKYGTVYHAPKCDWAQKIKKKSLMWFSSADEAKKAGYKEHHCIA
ncbi:hypothetical protein CL619_00480 [archaeon]|jgi:hypothetical protein|nr:hypothetical protein [archaeon]|tara:strand:- start:940 stop:1500 length:561 start_codon:yes stop_codon:yes gene_type:complete